MLSFGEEAEEEEKELASINKKIQSIHDVLNDPHFIKGESEEKELVILSLLKTLAFLFPLLCHNLVFFLFGSCQSNALVHNNLYYHNVHLSLFM